MYTRTRAIWLDEFQSEFSVCDTGIVYKSLELQLFEIDLNQERLPSAQG